MTLLGPATNNALHSRPDLGSAISELAIDIGVKVLVMQFCKIVNNIPQMKNTYQNSPAICRDVCRVEYVPATM